MRRARSVDAALPWLYLKGTSTGRMGEALEVLVGPDAKGLSSSVVSRLKGQWREEYGTSPDSGDSLPIILSQIAVRIAGVWE